MSSGHHHLAAVVSAEDLMGLDQRLHLLDRLSTELCEQIALRRAHIQRRLQRWSDFDEQCRQLTDAIAKCESDVEGNNDVPIEKLIVLLQTVSWLRWLQVASSLMLLSIEYLWRSIFIDSVLVVSFFR